MKHQLLMIQASAAMLLLSASSVAAAPTNRNEKHHGLLNPVDVVISHKDGNSKKIVRNINRTQNMADPIWRPKSEMISVFENNSWTDVESNTIEYYDNGKPKVELCQAIERGRPTREVSRSSYEYNADGFQTLKVEESSSDRGATFTVNDRTTSAYDSRIAGLIIENRQWINIDNQLLLSGNCYNRNITRNADGNITLVEIATLFNDVFDPSERLTVEYGADGKASTLKNSLLDYDGINFYWKDGAIYTDIVWEVTDGQIYRTEKLMLGNNRIKSARCQQGNDNYTIEVDYLNERGDYEATYTGMMSGVETVMKSVYTSLNDYNSERITQTFTYVEDGVTYVEKYTEAIEYDKWGYMTLYEYVDLCDPDEPIIERRQVGEIEYSTENGFPSVYTLSEYDFDTNELVPIQRVTFDNYIDVASAEITTADSSDAHPVYYNLQGVRVENPSAGLYIMRQGTQTSKVIIR